MRIDERYYRRVFHTQHRELHEAVVDYISYFLHRRKALNAETTVEQIRRHCERATGNQIPLDISSGPCCTAAIAWSMSATAMSLALRKPRR